ncbi:MAG: glycosyltransferase family 2 protein [Nanohaloarchaea archaeon]|nr:glycosyltransferase family 2 protein [Candidatus Nanohaloarchaea archaeon]
MFPDIEKLAERTGFLALSAALIAFGFWQGLEVYYIEIPRVAFNLVMLDATFSSLGFAAFIIFSGAVFGLKIRSRNMQTSQEADLTAFIPTYHDSEVLHRSVESLSESNLEGLKTVIICEPEDKEGIKEAEKLSEKEGVDYIINRGESSKAGALNYAVSKTDSKLLAFFDADQKVPEDFLPTAVKLLDKHDAVQGRYLPMPEDGVIESLAYYESVVFNYAVRQLLYVFTGFRMIASRATVISREKYEEIDGYGEKMLTEDFDFAHTCYKQGFDVKDMNRLPVKEESAHNMKDWWGQRKRWMRGYFQVFGKLVRNTNTKNYRSFLSVIICGSSLIGSFLMLTIVSKFIILFFTGSSANYLAPLLGTMSIPLLIRIKDFRDGEVRNIGLSWILTPLMFPLFSLVTVKAFFEQIFEGQNDWYQVEKSD